MAKQVQFRRGSKIENDAFLGAAGEITIDMDSLSPRIHDGAKSGGYMVSPFAVFGGVTYPTNGSFQYENGTGFSSTTQMDNGYGMTLAGINDAASPLFAYQTVVYSGDFSVMGVLKAGMLNTGSWQMGLYIADNAGKRTIFGFSNSGFIRSRYASLTDTASITQYSGDQTINYTANLYRIRRTGSTIYFEISLDGMNFDVIASENATEFLGSDIASVGFAVVPENMMARLVVNHFVTQPF